MKRSLLFVLLFGCLCPLPLAAVTVSISVTTTPLCAYANGELSANASGGVGPYTYLWSTGATTPTITGIDAGFYSVTVTDFNSDQATDDIDLIATTYNVQNASVDAEIGICSTYGAMVISPPEEIGGIYGPPPYYVDGMQMLEFPPDILWGSQTYYASGYAPTNGYGQYYTLPFMDGGGCTGTITGHTGWPVEWPTISVLDVQGSCSGGNNGSIMFHTDLEGHQQFTQVVVRTAVGADVTYFGNGGYYVQTNTVTGLAPGDYWLVQFMTMSPFLPSSGCGDSVMVTVPDLGNTCGNVSGAVYMDYNEDCARQGNEPFVPATVLEILPGPYYAVTSAGGAYSLNLPLGSYTLQQQSATLDEHCVGAPLPFTLTGGAGLANLNLADTSLVALDAMLTMASGAARPGFPLSYALEVENLTPASTGALTLTFTFDPLLGFNNASPTASVAGNVITWTLPALGAFQRTTVHASLQVPPDILLLGTNLLSMATVTCADTDADLANNAVNDATTVTGAYDPNDKVGHTSTGSSDTNYFIDLDEYLDYTIRFQNTGTDTAFNIVVTDVIAPELDLGSFIAGAASHTYSVEIREGNVLRFAFYNIQLPDSNANEPLSHGFVSFRIKPTGSVLPGTLISNAAAIYFDFNPPVITEPSLLVAEFSTGVVLDPTGSPRQLTLLPNPAIDQLTIASGAIVDAITILAADGREVLRRSVRALSTSLDVSGLSPGSYFLIATMNSGSIVHEHFTKN